MPLTFGDVAAATSGRLVGGDETQGIDGVSIDSRALVAGDLFVAIRGDRFDGHRFVADAFARGARGAVVEERSAECAGGATGTDRPTVICVEDTTRALQDSRTANLLKGSPER